MTTETIITIILSIFASSGLWAFLSDVLKNRKKKLTPNDKMILALTRDKLLSLNKKYRKLAFIPSSDFETYTALGEAYIAAGGNSNVRKGFEDNQKLPIKDEEDNG